MPSTTLNVSRATATLTIAGGADGVTFWLAAKQIGPISKRATDVDTATAVCAAVNTHPVLSGIVEANNEGQVITLTAKAAGASGNDISLETEAPHEGQLLQSGYHLDGGVSVVISY